MRNWSASPQSFPNTWFVDHIDRLPQRELEMAWIASIWLWASDCRKLVGQVLSASDFESEGIYDAGIRLLRNENFKGRGNDSEAWPDDVTAQLLMKHRLISEISRIDEAVLYFPNLHLPYAAEIRKRAKLR